MRSQLMAVATASPPFELRTEDVIGEATSIFSSRYQDFERLMPVFANTGIRRRQSVKPYSWFRQEQGWPERTAAYIEGATDLFRKAAKAALAQADLDPAEIDTIVTVSSTGIATPSIEARVMHDLGFHRGVSRIPVFGLGCAGGATGLSLAARLAQAPASNVLLVVIELCTLAFRPDEMTKSNIIATALFGDGAAACVLSGKEKDGLGTIEFTGEHSWPDTLDIMGWRMDPQGFGAIFSQRIPDFVTQELRAAADGFLERNGLAVERYRPVRLSSGRRQGHRGTRTGLPSRPGHARDRAPGARRSRKHVGADAALRPQGSPEEALHRPAVPERARPRLHLELRHDGELEACSSIEQALSNFPPLPLRSNGRGCPEGR